MKIAGPKIAAGVVAALLLVSGITYSVRQPNTAGAPASAESTGTAVTAAKSEQKSADKKKKADSSASKAESADSKADSAPDSSISKAESADSKAESKAESKPESKAESLPESTLSDTDTPESTTEIIEEDPVYEDSVDEVSGSPDSGNRKTSKKSSGHTEDISVDDDTSTYVEDPSPSQESYTPEATPEPAAPAVPEPTPEPTREPVWVDPVYETIYHEEEGHYETIVVGTKVKCGPKCDLVFDTEEEWKEHMDAYVESNGGVCDHKHDRPTIIEVTEEVWVVDKEAWTEEVLVEEGHWE